MIHEEEEEEKQKRVDPTWPHSPVENSPDIETSQILSGKGFRLSG